jgi:predicted PhzF superfamily epimerase YddE/YHI9
VSIPYYQIDAFTGNLFSGNPAGVCLLTDWLPDATLQSIAAENNLAETAFVVQRDSYFDLRWFTPTLEMDLCGHATLAPAHVIFRHLGYRDSVVRFQTRAGLLTVTRNDDVLTLDFPARPASVCPAPADWSRVLAAHPQLRRKPATISLFSTRSRLCESFGPTWLRSCASTAWASSPPPPATTAILSRASSPRVRAFPKIQ